MIDNFDSLFRCVYNAYFWRRVGLRNKRASEVIESYEKKWLEEHIYDVSDTISQKRDMVVSYMKENYGKKGGMIEKLNETDKKETYNSLLEERKERREKEALEEATAQFLEEQIPWVKEIKTTPSTNSQDVLTEMYIKAAERSEDTVCSDVEDHFGVIRSICMKYPSDESSKQILSYLESQGIN
jgi:hypothetical protein